jgi:7-cyano-7-deazaguanine reductase
MTEFKTELKSIKNRWNVPYEITHRCPELTFIGVKEQPDFGYVQIHYIPSNTLIELKSLKHYFYKFRNQLYSYESLVNLIFEDIKEIYQPKQLEVLIELNPRGGISSVIRRREKET